MGDGTRERARFSPPITTQMLGDIKEYASGQACLGRAAGDIIGNRPLTRSALEPKLASFGITRVADLTGLDVIGIPVWAAYRPQSRTLSVTNGKGLTPEQAWLSAVMECAEQEYAERAADVVAAVCTADEMIRGGHATVPLERQSRCAFERYDPEMDLAWVKGFNWRDGTVVYAPFELVGLDMMAEAPWNRALFEMSSTGLGAAATMQQAVLHALCELAEEDAISGTVCAGTLNAKNGSAAFNLARSHDLLLLLHQIERAGFSARFALPKNDFDLPVVMAAISGPGLRGETSMSFSGSACRCSLEDAAADALLEAIQSRLTFISGARDDLLEWEYARADGVPNPQIFHSAVFSTDESDAVRTPGDALKEIAHAVLDGPSRDFYVFPLGGEEMGISIVRVLADDLVSVARPEGSRASQRMGRKLLAQWCAA